MAARKQRVVAEYADGGWLVMFGSGTVMAFTTPDAVLREVKRRAKRGNKDVTLTTVEWRNAPDGFVQPQ